MTAALLCILQADSPFNRDLSSFAQRPPVTDRRTLLTLLNSECSL